MSSLSDSDSDSDNESKSLKSSSTSFFKQERFSFMLSDSDDETPVRTTSSHSKSMTKSIGTPLTKKSESSTENMNISDSEDEKASYMNETVTRKVKDGGSRPNFFLSDSEDEIFNSDKTTIPKDLSNKQLKKEPVSSVEDKKIPQPVHKEKKKTNRFSRKAKEKVPENPTVTSLFMSDSDDDFSMGSRSEGMDTSEDTPALNGTIPKPKNDLFSDEESDEFEDDITPEQLLSDADLSDDELLPPSRKKRETKREEKYYTAGQSMASNENERIGRKMKYYPKPTNRYNPYILYNKLNRKKIAEENPNITVNELNALVRKGYFEMDPVSRTIITFFFTSFLFKIAYFLS